jgi:hypothetical protein
VQKNKVKKHEKKEKKKKKRGKKSAKKREEWTVDYCCNPQCIKCGWTVNSPYHLAYYLIESLMMWSSKNVCLYIYIAKHSRDCITADNTIANSCGLDLF